jgi:hypothetical protein
MAVANAGLTFTKASIAVFPAGFDKSKICQPSGNVRVYGLPAKGSELELGARELGATVGVEGAAAVGDGEALGVPAHAATRRATTRNNHQRRRTFTPRLFMDFNCV